MMLSTNVCKHRDKFFYRKDLKNKGIEINKSIEKTRETH